MAPISAFDFDILKSVVISVAASVSQKQDHLRELARMIGNDYRPDEPCPDEVLDALVVQALHAIANPNSTS